MLNGVKNIGRLLIPKSLFRLLQPLYHGALSYIANTVLGSPSNHLYVIGVTGTAGKSTTVTMLAHILNHTGYKTGYITTVESYDGQHKNINKHGLSMQNEWLLAKSLKKFTENDCKYAVIECTSEGLAQNRHSGIKFMAALFTNLSPAHLDAHGSFENYRSAKGKLFSAVMPSGIIGTNADDANVEYFLSFPAKIKFGISWREDKSPQIAFPVLKATNIEVAEFLSFTVENIKFKLQLKGSFNIPNALLAIGLAQHLGISLEESRQALASFGTVPGRMESIANNLGITIIVDYAPEPDALKHSLQASSLINHTKLIHVFGATGGHRDKGKAFLFGQISAQFTDIIIITNDDVYESDQNEIAQNIVNGINQITSSTTKSPKVIIELDRKQALAKALSIASANDLILVTGKGSEQFLVLPGNTRIEWDDRAIIKELLN
jgi:UDP-N-acetylmuramoyl-L-alanyl-D-glutamate--2,6-diaminopimelate ligase